MFPSHLRCAEIMGGRRSPRGVGHLLCRLLAVRPVDAAERNYRRLSACASCSFSSTPSGETGVASSTSRHGGTTPIANLTVGPTEAGQHRPQGQIVDYFTPPGHSGHVKKAYGRVLHATEPPYPGLAAEPSARSRVLCCGGRTRSSFVARPVLLPAHTFRVYPSRASTCREPDPDTRLRRNPAKQHRRLTHQTLCVERRGSS